MRSDSHSPLFPTQFAGGVEEGLQGTPGIGHGSPQQYRQGAIGDPWPDPVPGVEQLAQEAVEVVLAEGKPTDGCLEGTDPIGEQGGLAIAGGGGDERQAVVEDAAVDSASPSVNSIRPASRWPAIMPGTSQPSSARARPRASRRATRGS